MLLFRIEKSKFIKTKENSINLEKDIQILTEQNLNEIFGLEIITSEFILENFRIDTLAFDAQTQSFVVIEYKRDQSFSIVDQGVSYLNTIFRNKAELILEYNERKKKNLNRDSVDWNQIRVIFIAQRFTSHQQNVVGFRDFPIELWEVKRFENNLILFNQIKPPETKESIGTIAKGKLIKDIAKEIKEYSLDDHYKKASSKTKEILEILREKIIELDINIKERPVKNYIGYKLNWYNFVSVFVYKDRLKVYVRKEKIDNDDKKQFTKVPDSYKWGTTPLWWIGINNTNDLNYLIKVIKESYNSAPDK